MKTKILSRRNFINRAALSALAVCLFGCTKSVTKYRPDGTPYTEEEEDPVATLAAFVLLLIIIGAYAASKRHNEDDSYGLNEKDDWEYFPNDKNKIWAASMVSGNNIPSSETEGKISVTDSKGKLLAVANGSANIQHKDLPALESILSSAKISNLQKPVAIRLKQNKLSVYQIESIRFIHKSSSGQYRIVERNINRKSYKIKVFPCSDKTIDIEIEPSITVNQNVA